jgi:hypothetical protein
MNILISTFLSISLVVFLSSCNSEQSIPVPTPSQKTLTNILKDSDDYVLHKKAFDLASSDLIQNGKCTEEDFREMGGWMKSMTHKKEPIYFTYCGCYDHVSCKVYLNVKTKQLKDNDGASL